MSKMFCTILNFIFLTVFDNFEFIPCENMIILLISISNKNNVAKHNYMFLLTISNLTNR